MTEHDHIWRVDIDFKHAPIDVGARRPGDPHTHFMIQTCTCGVARPWPLVNYRRVSPVFAQQLGLLLTATGYTLREIE